MLINYYGKYVAYQSEFGKQMSYYKHFIKKSRFRFKLFFFSYFSRSDCLIILFMTNRFLIYSRENAVSKYSRKIVVYNILCSVTIKAFLELNIYIYILQSILYLYT